MDTFKLTAPREFTTKVYNKPKGDPERQGVHMVHNLADWHDTALEALVVKGVQRLVNDLLSGVDAAEKPKEFRKVLDKLNAGASWADAAGIKPRVASGGADAITLRARSLIRKAIKAKLDAAEYKRDYTDADAADQIKRLDAALEKNPAFVDKARAELEAEAKMAESLDL